MPKQKTPRESAAILGLGVIFDWKEGIIVSEFEGMTSAFIGPLDQQPIIQLDQPAAGWLIPLFFTFVAPNSLFCAPQFSHQGRNLRVNPIKWGKGIWVG